METKKGLYYDGHERPEVILDRQERFLPAIEELKKNAVWVEEDEAGNASIVNADKPFLPVSADQKGHHSNERPGWYGNLRHCAILSNDDKYYVQNANYMFSKVLGRDGYAVLPSQRGWKTYHDFRLHVTFWPCKVTYIANCLQ